MALPIPANKSVVRRFARGNVIRTATPEDNTMILWLQEALMDNWIKIFQVLEEPVSNCLKKCFGYLVVQKT
jgi:hypothetical protein